MMDSDERANNFEAFAGRNCSAWLNREEQRWDPQCSGQRGQTDQETNNRKASWPRTANTTRRLYWRPMSAHSNFWVALFYFIHMACIFRTVTSTTPSMNSATLDLSTANLIIYVANIESIHNATLVSFIRQDTSATVFTLNDMKDISVDTSGSTVSATMTAQQQYLIYQASNTDSTSINVAAEAAAFYGVGDEPNEQNQLTATINSDTTGPSQLNQATLNLNTGILMLQFQEYVDASTWNGTLVQISGDTITENLSTSDTEGDSTVDEYLIITLTEGQRSSLSAYAAQNGALAVTVFAAAVKDLAGNSNAQIESYMINLTQDSTAATASSAALDLNDGTLTITFSEYVDASSWDSTLATITNSDSSYSATLDGATLDDSTTDAVLTIQLSEDQRSALSAEDAASETLTLTITSGFVKDYGAVSCAGGSASMTVTSDSTAATTGSAALDLNDGTLTITFSEYVDASSWDSSLATITNSDSSYSETLDGATLDDSTTDAILTIQLSEDQRSALSAEDAASETLTLTITSGFVKDYGAVSCAGGSASMTVTSDSTAATTSSAALDLNDGTLTITFSEYVDASSWDSSLATITNSDSSYSATLDGATLDDSTTDAVLTIQLSEDQRSALSAEDAASETLTLTITSGFVKDYGAVSCAGGSASMTVTSDSTAATTGSAALDLNDGILTITFSEYVDASSWDSTLATITNSDSSYSATLDGATLDDSTTDAILTIQLSEDQRSALSAEDAASETLTLTITSGFVKDYGAVSCAGGSASMTVTSDSTAATTGSAALDLNDGTLTITFSEYVDASSWDSSLATITNSDSSYSATLDGATLDDSTTDAVLTIQLSEDQRSALSAEDAASETLTLTITSGFVKDYGAVSCAGGSASMTVTSDSTAATTGSAALDLNDGILTITFSEYVDASSWDSSLATITNSDSSYSETLDGATLDDSTTDAVLTIQLSEDQRSALSAEDAANEILTLTITSGFVKDYGAVSCSGGSASMTVTSDSTAATTSSAALDLNDGTLTITFSEYVDASSWDSSLATITNSDSSYSATLDGATLDDSTTDAVLTIQLSEDQRSALSAEDAASETLTLTITSGFVKDYGAVSCAGGSASMTVTSDSTAATTSSAALDLNDGTLTITFSEYVDASSWDSSLATITNSDSSYSATLDGATLDDSTTDAILTIQLSEDQRSALSAEDAASETLTLTITSGFVKDYGAVSCSGGSASMTVTSDSTAATTSSPALDLNDGILTITFSEYVDASSWDSSLATITNSDSSYSETLDGATLDDSTTDAILTIQLSEDQRSALSAEDAASETLTLTITSGFVKDYGAVSCAGGSASMTVTSDSTAATTGSAALDLNDGTLTITFSEYVDASSWDSTLATITNSDSSYSATLDGATLDDSTTDAILTIQLSEDQRSALSAEDAASETLTLTITSGFVKDYGAVSCAGGSASMTVTSDSTAATTSSAALDLNDGTLTITFSEYVDASSWDSSLATITNSDSSYSATLDGATLDDSTTDAVLTIQLSEDQRSALSAEDAASETLTLTITSGFVKDYGAVSCAGGSASMTVTSDSTAATTSSAALDLNDGILTITFSEYVVATSWDSSLATITNSNSSYSETLDGATLDDSTTDAILTIQLSEDQRSALSAEDAANEILTLTITSGFVKDYGAVSCAGGSVTMTVTSDTTNPEVTFAKLDLNVGLLELSFDEYVNFSSWNSAGLTFSTGTYSGSLSYGKLSNVSEGDTMGIVLSESQRVVLATEKNQSRSVSVVISNTFVADFGRNFNIASNVVASTLADSTSPRLRNASLDLNDGMLIFVFNETIDTSAWDRSKATVYSGEYSSEILLGTTLASSSSEKTVILNLVESQRSALSSQVANGEEVGISLLKGFCSDVVGNLNTVANLTIISTPDSTSSQLVSGELDLNNGTLTLTFNEFVNASLWQAAEATISSDSYSGTLENSILDDQTVDYSVVIVIPEAQRAELSAVAAEGSAINISISAYFIQDYGLVFNDAGTISLSLTMDTTIPVISSVYVDLNDGLVNISFSEYINVSTWNGTQALMVSSDYAGDLSNASISLAETVDDHLLLVLSELQRSKLSATAAASFEVVARFQNGFISDYGHNLNEGTNITAGMNLDTTPPTSLSVILDLNYGILEILFSEFVDLTTWHGALISLQSSGLNKSLEGTSTIVQSSQELVAVVLQEADRSVLASVVASSQSISLHVSVGAIKDFGGVNSTLSSLEVNSTADTKLPTIQNSTLNLNDGRLVIQFDEYIIMETCNLSQATIASDNYSSSLDSATFDETSSNGTVEIDLSEEQRSVLAEKMVSGFSISVTLSAIFATDYGENYNTAGTITVAAIPDTVAPVFSSAELNLNTGVLQLEFSEFVDPISWNGTQVNISTIEFAGNLEDATMNSYSTGYSITLTLSESERSSLSAEVVANNSIELTLLSGFILDSGNNPNMIGSMNVSTLADTTKPNPLSAALDLNNGELIISFDEFMDAATWNGSLIVLSCSNFSSSLIESSLDDTATDEILKIKLSESLRSVFAEYNAAGETINLDISPSFARDYGNNPCTGLTSIAVSATADTTPPGATLGEMNLNDGTIVVTFDEFVEYSTWNGTEVNLIDGNYKMALTTATLETSIQGYEIRLLLLEDSRSELAGLDKNGGVFSMQLSNIVITDSAGNYNSAKIIPMNISHDSTSPALSSGMLTLNTGLLYLTFSEYILPNTTDFNNLELISGNYSTAGNVPVLVSNATNFTVGFRLQEAERSLIARATLADPTVFINISSAFVQDSASNGNLANSSEMQLALDDLPPYIMQSHLNLESRTLTLVFSEYLYPGSGNISRVELQTVDSAFIIGLDYILESSAQSDMGESFIWLVTLSPEQQVELISHSVNAAENITITMYYEAAIDYAANPVDETTLVLNVTADSTNPIVYSTTLNLATMELIVNVSEFANVVDLSLATVQSTSLEKIGVVSTKLYSGLTKVQLFSNTLKDEVTYAYLDGSSLTYSLDGGAFEDTAGNQLTATGSQAFSIVYPDELYPTITYVEVDLGFKTVTIVTNETVKNVSWGDFALQNSDTSQSVVLDTIQDHTANVTHTYAMSEAVHLAACLITPAIQSIAVQQNALYDLSSNPVEAVSAQLVDRIILDTVAPVVQADSIVLNLATGRLIFNVSEHIVVESVSLEYFTIVAIDDASTFVLDPSYSNVVTSDEYSTQLVVDIEVASRVWSVIADKRGSDLSIQFLEAAFSDVSGNANIAQTVSITQVFPDDVNPTITSVDLNLNTEILIIEFSEPVNVTRLNTFATLTSSLEVQTALGNAIPFEMAGAAYGSPAEFSSIVYFPIAEVSSRRSMNIAALSTSTFSLSYTANTSLFLDAADNIVEEQSESYNVSTLTLDSTSPIIESINIEIKNGRVIFYGDETLDPAQLDPSKVLVENLLYLDSAECAIQNVDTLSLNNTFVMSDPQIALYLPYMDNASDVQIYILPGAVADVMGNKNSETFEFVVPPDPTYFETRIISVNFEQIVRGASKSIEFVGTGLIAGQTAKWVQGSSCSDTGVSVNTDSESITVDTETYNVGPYKTIAQVISFDVESDPTPFVLCYQSELVSDWIMTVFAVQVMTQNSGASDHIVVGVPKTQTFSGVGVSTGDRVKWVESEDDCDETLTPLNQIPSIAATLTASLRAVSVQIGPRVDGQLVPRNLTLCYKFNSELFFYFSEFTLTVHQITEMSNSDRLVVAQNKTLSFEGINVEPSLDRIVWVESLQSTSDDHCNTNSTRLGISPTAELKGYLNVSVSIDAAPLPEREYSLCYGFQDEPLRLYSRITLTACEVVTYNVSQGSVHVAVRDVPKTFYFHGSGFDSDLDRITWTTDAQDSSSCEKFAGTIASANIGSQYSTGYGPLTFDATANMVYLCYGFGSSEPWQIYPNVYLQVRAVDSASLNRTIALLSPPEVITFYGLGLMATDRAKYVPQLNSLSGTELCLLDTSHGTTITATLGPVSVGAMIAVQFPQITSNLPYVLCYAHETEPYAIYETIVMEADGLISMSPTEFVEGLPYEVSFDTVGLEVYDVIRFMYLKNGEDASTFTDAMCETADIAYEVVVQDVVSDTLTFPQRTPSDTEEHPVCILFKRNMMAQRQKAYSLGVRALGIESVNLDHAVVGNNSTFTFTGTGIQEGDLVKWVSADEVSTYEDCESATSLSESNYGEEMGADRTLDISFLEGTSSAVLCYRFKNHPWYRLYSNIELVVNHVRDVSLHHAISNSPQTFVLDVAFVQAGDRVRFIPSNSSCESEFDKQTYAITIVTCEQRGSILAGLLSPFTNECAQIRATFTQIPAISSSLVLCYKFAAETTYTKFPALTVHVVAPTISAQDSSFFVSGVSKTLQLTGSFGLTTGDAYKFVAYDTTCSNDTATLSSVSTSLIGSDSGLVSGSASVIVSINVGEVDDADLLKFRPYRLCYRFGSQGPLLMYKERSLSAMKLTKVLLATRPDSVVAGSNVVFEFHGLGVADNDQAKWVAHGNLCSADGVAGSEAATVSEQRATFRFSSAASNMLLCYKFNDEPYTSYPSLTIGQVEYSEMVVDTSSDLSTSGSSSTVDTALSAAEEVSSKLVDEQSTIDSKLQKEAHIQISLDLSYETVPPGSVAETNFIANFTGAMGNALGIAADRVRVMDLYSGSIIVYFIILPPSSEDDTLPAEAAAAILLEKVMETTSTIFSAPSVLNFVKQDVAIEVVLIENEDALANANNTASAQLSQQQTELSISSYLQSGLVLFQDAVKVVVEKFDSYVDLYVIREHGTYGTVPVEFSTRDGTATASIHYTKTSGLLRFMDGEQNKTIRVPILRDEAAGPPFRWFVVDLTLGFTQYAAKLGTRKTALVKIFDYGDGESIASDSFAIDSGTSQETNGWTVSGNQIDQQSAWVDTYGLFSVDQLYASNEYNDRCDFASTIGPCTYSCTYGGSYTLTSGYDDGVLELSNSDDSYVASKDVWDMSLSSGFTISFWLKVNVNEETMTGRETIASYQITGQSGLCEIALVNPRDLTLVVHGRLNSNIEFGENSGLDLTDGKWHFVAVTWRSAGGEVNFFDNGVLVWEGGPLQADYSVQSGGSWVIGQAQGAEPCFAGTSCSFVAGRTFAGSLQNFRVWNEARSQVQIEGGMRWPFTLYQGSLRLYWRFRVGDALNHVVSNSALAGADHDGLLGSQASIEDGSPSASRNYPCGQVNFNTMYFEAPERYLGDLSEVYNGRLQFELFSPSQHGSARDTRGAVILEGNGLRISNSLVGFPMTVQGGGWRGFSVVLQEDHGWLLEPEGTSASFSAFWSVLRNVTRIGIRGDLMVYSRQGSGQETTYLNNVALVKA